MSDIPRPEHPRPQFERERWINLNGEWSFTFDFGKSGRDQGFSKSFGFKNKIIVPFCPESEISGVGHKDFIECLWYHRTIAIPHQWKGLSTILHFGAVDYSCEVFVDGTSVGTHVGGSSSFSFDLGSRVLPGVCHDLVVAVRDDMRSKIQTVGKQSDVFHSYGCHYTRVTGIWQTVWLEAVHPFGLKLAVITPDLDGSRFIVTPEFRAQTRGMNFRVIVFEGSKIVASVQGPALQGGSLTLPLKNSRTWAPEKPFLYDLVFELVDPSGVILDSVKSYAGLRKIHIEGNKIFLNNRERYLRFVLDQGYYPDGIWTAPSDNALKRDIELALRAGFNGARLHQKVFEERYHYWADKLGFLTWGESASWGLDGNNALAQKNFLCEWKECLVRDRNHPSIIAWTPFNETTGDCFCPQLQKDAYALCLNLDPTRVVNDASGYLHVQTDLYTVHNYTQDPEKLSEELSIQNGRGVFQNYPKLEVAYEGQPYIVDEFGGIKWVPDSRRPHAENSWGYGEGPKTIEEFYSRLEGQVCAIVSLGHVAGYCYTQLTDVEQEENGIYNYDRSNKFDMKRVFEIFSRMNPKEVIKPILE